MDVNDFIAELEGFGQELSNISPVLQELGDRITADMKADPNLPVASGALKTSIRAVVSDNKLEIDMLYYGAFQNYGVNGTSDNIANKVQFGVTPRPTSEPFYAFKKRKFGLRPQQFFNLDLLEELVITTLTEETEI